MARIKGVLLTVSICMATTISTLFGHAVILVLDAKITGHQILPMLFVMSTLTLVATSGVCALVVHLD